VLFLLPGVVAVGCVMGAEGEAAGTTGGAESAAVEAPAEPRRELFSDDEIARLYDRLTPPPAPSFMENGAETLDEEVIMLEPYVVEGDRGPLLPSIRRRLELGPESIRKRVEEMAPRESRIAESIGRNTDAFFKDSGNLGPGDRPEMVRLNDRDAAKISRDIGNWVGRGLKRIFRQ
jgi:hypothetical protein